MVSKLSTRDEDEKGLLQGSFNTKGDRRGVQRNDKGQGIGDGQKGKDGQT
jgi:hypothetical protein